MILRSLPILCRAVTAGALAMAVASCSSTNTPGPGGHVTKVKYFHLMNREVLLPGTDPSVAFERQYHLHGAISAKDRDARDGHYYAVMWKVTDRTQPVKVRLEYRQQNTGMKVQTLEQEVTKIDRSNLNHFEVIGEPYEKHGSVTSWRVSLVRGQQVLAEAKSYLWD